MAGPKATDDNLVRLRVDPAGVIVSANPAFDRFASDNGAPDLTANAVVGRKLDHFVADADTREWLGLLLKSTRELKRIFVRLYRCDSPDLRRLMRMRLQPLADGSIDMEHKLVATSPLIHRRLLQTTALSTAAICRCSLCNRLRIDDIWHQPDDAPLGEGPTKVYYGICDDCRAGLAPN